MGVRLVFVRIVSPAQRGSAKRTRNKEDATASNEHVGRIELIALEDHIQKRTVRVWTCQEQDGDRASAFPSLEPFADSSMNDDCGLVFLQIGNRYMDASDRFEIVLDLERAPGVMIGVETTTNDHESR